MSNYRTAGPASIITGAVAAVAMIAATALLLPNLAPEGNYGICLPSPNQWVIPYAEVPINAVLILIAVTAAFFINRRYSFVKGTEGILPTSLAVLLASNPVNTSYLGIPVIMLIVNLVCLDIMMKAYRSPNATTQMFAVATYLSLGSMIQYAFLPMMLVYPVIALMAKVLRPKETIAYVMGLLAPYWVLLGFGIISPQDFRMPQFLAIMPQYGTGFMLFIFISLGTLALTCLMMSLNNVMLIYSGNIRERTFNNMITLLGLACLACMLADFDNFQAYSTTFCFTAAVQISNFFAMRRIPRSHIWFWSLMSLFIVFYILMVVDATIAK
ncbi:MAG: hypothetical protein J5995_09280 [Muribaculaceae bacterium]|nr:hypothetical protein [Muribaculaceae bacterium]